MATTLARKVVRETTVVDCRTHKPYLICLEEGGKLVRLWVKGTRKANAYVVPIEAIVTAGARLRAEELRRRKLELKKLRRLQAS